MNMNMENDYCELKAECNKFKASHKELIKACKKAEQLMESMMVPMGIKKEGSRPNNVLRFIQQTVKEAKKLGETA